MFVSDQWKEYELTDASDGERLERWGKYTLIRPDPQVIWKDMKASEGWNTADASYHRQGGGGEWSRTGLPDEWQIGYRDLRFLIRPMGFKHTGLFPEQATNWDWMTDLIRGAGRPVSVLNLFAYTGGATVACAKAGASVCHVDAAKGIVQYAKENAALNGLSEAPIRYIVDDCRKFAQREIRRGHRYDGIIMDPPSYGRGPGGEVWKLEDCIDVFLREVAGLLSDKPLFFLMNSYTTGLSASTSAYMVASRILSQHKGDIRADEVGLPVRKTGLLLPCGSSVRVRFS